MRNFLIYILPIILLVPFTQSIYFLVHKGVPKCFFEEFYKDSIIALRYATLEDFQEEGEHEHEPVFEFIIKNADTGKELDTLQGINPRGKINFIVNESGSYSICVKPREDAKIFGQKTIMKLSVVIEPVDENAGEQDLSAIPKNKDFEKVGLKVDKMHKKIVDIMRAQNYQINREDEFSKNQIENSSAIVTMTVIQVLILLILSVWQVYSFKRLFKDQLNNLCI